MNPNDQISANPDPAPPMSVPSGFSDSDKHAMNEVATFLAAALQSTKSQPQASATPSYFSRFNGVSVGEKLLTATGYGAITCGTFAGCCGIAKLMGVVK